MNCAVVLCMGMFGITHTVQGSISEPITAKPLDVTAIRDPLKRMEKIQIGLTGANTQVFDRPNLILNPPSDSEFDRWDLPFNLAIKDIRSIIPDLAPACDQLVKINRVLKQFFFIVSQEKTSYDSESVERYEMLINAQKDSFRALDNSFKAFSVFYDKKIRAQEQELAADNGLWAVFFGTEERERELVTKRQALLLTRVVIETFRAIINKILEKDIPATKKQFELSLESL